MNYLLTQYQQLLQSPYSRPGLLVCLAGKNLLASHESAAHFNQWNLFFG